MGKSQRTKGHNFEREVAMAFRNALGLSSEQVKRGLSQPRGGTAEEPDVVLPPELPMWIECKVGQRPNLLAAMEQARKAIAAAKSDKVPLAVCKKDRSTAVVVMELDAFLELLKARKAAES
jgi:Holliday junction resolvase